MADKDVKLLKRRLQDVIDITIERYKITIEFLEQAIEDVEKSQSVDELKAIYRDVFNFLGTI